MSEVLLVGIISGILSLVAIGISIIALVDTHKTTKRQNEITLQQNKIMALQYEPTYEINEESVTDCDGYKRYTYEIENTGTAVLRQTMKARVLIYLENKKGVRSEYAVFSDIIHPNSHFDIDYWPKSGKFYINVSKDEFKSVFKEYMDELREDNNREDSDRELSVFLDSGNYSSLQFYLAFILKIDYRTKANEDKTDYYVCSKPKFGGSFKIQIDDEINKSEKIFDTDYDLTISNSKLAANKVRNKNCFDSLVSETSDKKFSIKI
jgi:hypothetical protein